jgi:hypothetical protein
LGELRNLVRVCISGEWTVGNQLTVLHSITQPRPVTFPARLPRTVWVISDVIPCRLSQTIPSRKQSPILFFYPPKYSVISFQWESPATFSTVTTQVVSVPSRVARPSESPPAPSCRTMGWLWTKFSIALAAIHLILLSMAQPENARMYLWL